MPRTNFFSGTVWLNVGPKEAMAKQGKKDKRYKEIQTTPRPQNNPIHPPKTVTDKSMSL